MTQYEDRVPERVRDHTEKLMIAWREGGRDALDYICRHYGVPAKIGGRVRYTGDADHPEGTIVGTTGHYLRIKLDGDDEPNTFHPTWQITYLDGEAEA